jgi:PTS system nitrogen regulatory IIA component
MIITDCFSATQIRFFQEETSKNVIVEEVVRSFVGIDSTVALQAIQTREQIGSTLIASDVIIPHARLAGLDRIHAGIAVTPSLVYIVFLSSAKSMSEHLAFLSGVAALFQTEGMSQRIRALSDASEVLALLRQEETAPVAAL